MVNFGMPVAKAYLLRLWSVYEGNGVLLWRSSDSENDGTDDDDVDDIVPVADGVDDDEDGSRDSGDCRELSWW